MKKEHQKYSSREFFPIENISSDIVKLKNGSYIKILKILPININLKTDFEKQAILNSYKNFLLSIDFNFQIIIQSKKEEIQEHIKHLESNFVSNKIEDLISSYKEYIISKIEENLASKSFYIIISYKPDFLNEQVNFDSIQKQLNNMYKKIKQGLDKIGNKVIEVNNSNQELDRLIYSFTNTRLSNRGVNDSK